MTPRLHGPPELARAKGLAKRRYRNSTRGPQGWYAVTPEGRPWVAAAEPEEFKWPF